MSVTLITPTTNKFNKNIQYPSKVQSYCQTNIEAPQTSSYTGKLPFSACYLSFKGYGDNLSVLDSFRLKLNKLGVNSDITDNMQQKDMKKWDLRFINTLKGFNDFLRYEKNISLSDLLSPAIQGTYKDFLFDPETEIGKANLNTKKCFEKAGLNYDKWLNYGEKKEFEYNGKQYEIGLWKREPETDLFIGNIAKSCISTVGSNSDVIYGGLVNTNVQYILVKEKATKEVKAYARVYFLQEQKSKEKNIFLDKYEQDFDDCKAYLKSEPHLLNFIENYSNAVTNNHSSKTLSEQI
ncbi:MAG: hypothetical protein WCG23_12395, partial [bacterium]